jgi:catechol 2,3-dioxygenase-like lactoylglutathione lyase family enzyme
MTSARELRFAFIFDDYDAALHLFRDVFGLETLKDLDHQGGRGVILRVPSATLELFDREHGELVDYVETGRPLDDRAGSPSTSTTSKRRAGRWRLREPRRWPITSSRHGATTTSGSERSTASVDALPIPVVIACSDGHEASALRSPATAPVTTSVPADLE